MNKKLYVILLVAAFSSPLYAGGEIKDTTGLSTLTSDNITELLRGRLPGVRVSAVDNNPNGLLNVHIRGINSLRSDNQPLWIVDGVALSGALNDNLDAFWQYGEKSYTAPLSPIAFLSPDDIESIEVLSDISATAIYGSRGANGVIIVKTKSGAPESLKILLSSQMGVITNASFASGPRMSHRHRVSVSGGAKNTKYSFAASLRDERGALPRNGSLYGNLLADYETQTNKTIWFGVKANITVGTTSNLAGTAYLGSSSYLLALRDPAFSPGTSAQQWLDDYDDNSLDFRGLISTYLQFNLLRNLHLRIEGGTDLQAFDRTIWYGLHTDLGAISEQNLSGGAASVLSSSLFSYNGRAILDYQTYFAIDHRLSLRVAADAQGYANHFNTMNGRDFVSHQLRGKSLNLMASLPQNHLFRSRYFLWGSDAYLHYDWKEIVGLNATFRYDAAPKYTQFGKNMYPAAEAYVNYRWFRLSGGYGISGRHSYIPYELSGKYLTGDWTHPDPGTESFIDGVERLRTTEWHVKAQVSVLKDRLKAGLCYYDRNTSDLFSMYSFASAPTTTSSGTFYRWVKDPALIFSRESKIANRGFELNIEATPVEIGNWRWALSFNGAYNINRLTSSNVEDYRGRVVGHDIYCSVNVVGEPVSSLYGYRSDASGNYLDTTGEGRITTADKLLLGRTVPLLTGGASTVVQWKNLSAEIALDYAAGFNIANIAALVKDGVVDSYGDVVLSSRYVEKGDFCRIDYIGLKWHLPFQYKWLHALDFSLAVKNPVVFTGYSGWNPDVNSFGISALSNGFDYGSYPLTRTILLGVKVNF